MSVDVRVASRRATDAENPWPGLAPFEEDDSEFFHGRDGAIDALLQLVDREDLVLLYGSSGLGKTSLLRAGLFPRIPSPLLPVYIRLHYDAAAEKPDLRRQVIDAVVLEAERRDIDPPPPAPSGTLWEFFRRRNYPFWGAGNEIVVPLLVFDQFEQLFTRDRLRGLSTREIDDFLEDLGDLVNGRTPPWLNARTDAATTERYIFQATGCKAIFSFREDFLADVAQLSAVPFSERISYRLEPLRWRDAVAAVRSAGGGLLAAGTDLSRQGRPTDVAEAIVCEVSGAADRQGERSVDPAILSVFCRELNEERKARAARGESPLIDVAMVQGSKTAEIISSFYRRAVADVPAEVRRFIEDRLTLPSGARNSVAEEEIVQAGLPAEPIASLIESWRVLRREVVGRQGQIRLELTHDVLVKPVLEDKRARQEQEHRERELAAEREAAERRFQAEQEARQRADVMIEVAGTRLDDLVSKIVDATGSFDKQTTRILCDELIQRLLDQPDPYPPDKARSILGALRRKGYSDLVESVAEAMIQSGQAHPTLQRYYALALTDNGSITAAVGFLKTLLTDTAPGGALENSSDHAQSLGLIGGAYKKAYVDAVNPVMPGTPQRRMRARVHQRKLHAAIDAYSAVYREHPAETWHGINAVACLCRARRDGLSRPTDMDPRDMAEQILVRLEAIPPGKVHGWDCATAVEAYVALDDLPRALEWLARYVIDGDTDVFELTTMLRQLEEVWELMSAPNDGDRILLVLRSELLRRQGGPVQLGASGEPVPASKQGQSALEAAFGDERFVSLEWYRTGLQACRAVARIDDAAGIVRGSGFLIRGEDVHPRFKSEMLLVTTARTVSDDRFLQSVTGAIPPERVHVRFELQDTQAQLRIRRLLWTSPASELDATIAVLNEQLPADRYLPIAGAMPRYNDRVYVIGHPEGRNVSMSLQDNRVIAVNPPFIQYRSPTAQGSSGGPVLNDAWEIVAMHHAGGKEATQVSREGNVQASEGILIQELLQAFQRTLSW
jgi:hypothetical protein